MTNEKQHCNVFLLLHPSFYDYLLMKIQYYEAIFQSISHSLSELHW